MSKTYHQFLFINFLARVYNVKTQLSIKLHCAHCYVHMLCIIVLLQWNGLPLVSVTNRLVFECMVDMGFDTDIK